MADMNLTEREPITWLEQFKEKSLYEMRMEIHRLPYFRDPPWYRIYFQFAVTFCFLSWIVMLFATLINCGGNFQFCGTQESLIWVFFVFFSSFLATFPLLPRIGLYELYDRFSSDDIPLFLSFHETRKAIEEGWMFGDDHCYYLQDDYTEYLENVHGHDRAWEIK